MTLIFNTRPAMVMNHARAKIQLKDQVMQQLRVETVGLTDGKTDGTDFYRATLCQCGICCRRVSVRPSVRPSVTSRYCIETTGEIELFWAWSLPSTYSTLCYKEIWVSPKIRPKLRTWKISIALSRKIVDVTVLRRFRAYIGGGVATNTVVSVPTLSYD